jgi:ferredoxin
VGLVDNQLNILRIDSSFVHNFIIFHRGGSSRSGSNYCEMGIDVKWYAQRGQDIVRASCVGCGICSEVCPRGVLKLETSTRASKKI